MKLVKIYYKGYCPYCQAALKFLKENGVEHTAIDVELSKNKDEFEALKQRHHHRTVPMIFVGEEFIGGNDDMMALHKKGGFLTKLSD